MEEWRDIELYPNYQVSNLGNVRSVTHIDSMGRVKKGQNKKLKKHQKGYLVVVLNLTEISKITGVSISTISRMRNGK